MSVEQIKFADSREWFFTTNSSELQHKTGRFFAIKGVSFQVADFSSFELPLIDQSEIGLLGFVVCKIAGELNILFQAKIEPGNVGGFQFAPTVQATQSNYERAHGGADQPYLEFFASEKYKVLHDSLQTEQGWKFLFKRNRNIVVEIPQPVEPLPLFKWIPISTAIAALDSDHLLNSDARSVLTCLLLSRPEYLQEFRSTNNRLLLESLRQRTVTHKRLITWYKKNAQKKQHLELKPLSKLRGWEIVDDKITHKDNAFHDVIQIKVNTNCREVENWDQPIVNSHEIVDIELIARVRAGRLEVLLKAETQPGLIGHLGLSASLVSDRQLISTSDNKLSDWFQAYGMQAWRTLKAEHSEEGGRFYLDKCRYRISIFPTGTKFPKLDSTYRWLSLRDMAALLETGRVLTNELRSALAVLISSNSQWKDSPARSIFSAFASTFSLVSGFTALCSL
jgi:oxidase EvaA